MPKPAYKNASKEWLAEYAPEYLAINGGKSQVKVYPTLPPPSGTYAVSYKTIPELRPWSYWSSPIDPQGVIYVKDYNDPTKMPWTVAILDVYYRAWVDSCNWFRNGGKTPIRGVGLDPALLNGVVAASYPEDVWEVDGQRVAMSPEGVYLFSTVTGTKPPNASAAQEPEGGWPKEGNEATFTMSDGTLVYTSDHLTSKRDPKPFQYDSAIVKMLTGA